jgi:ABC-2 type transport system permease protein
MTAATLPGSPVAAGPQLAPGRAVSRLAVRQLRLGAAVVALIAGVMSAVVASQYEMISSLLDESGLRAMAGNPIERILLGPPVAVDDPGGFTVWRTGTLISVLASGWVVLATTRITRGEEDAGRWSLLLAGRLRMADIVIRCLAALVGSATLIGVAVAAGLLAARTEPAGAVIHAAGITCIALTFATIALLAAQVMPGRSGATGLTVAALGVGLALRMIADGSHQLAWLAWATPFGLTARTAPYADNRVVPLIVLAAFPIVLAGAAIFAARHRDLGDGIVAVPDSRPPRTRLLQSIGGFALRRTARITLGWATGIVAFFLLVGALLASVLEFFHTNARIAELAAAAGMSGLGSVNVFAASLFSLLPVPTGLYAVMRLATMVADEKAGRWTMLLAQPISRVRQMSAEIAVTVGGVVALHCSAAAAIWSGAKITGAPLQFTDSLAGALNPLPVALLATGFAALGVGWLPSAAGAIGALPILGGFLVNAIMQTFNAPRWVANLSPWAHLAPVPETPPHWAATIIFLLITGVLTALGLYGYVKRDLAT